jgi:hypothetical protein
MYCVNTSICIVKRQAAIDTVGGSLASEVESDIATYGVGHPLLE